MRSFRQFLISSFDTRRIWRHLFQAGKDGRMRPDETPFLSVLSRGLRKDSALQSCSIAARGLWIEMMCIMHECEPYGYLSINGHAMNAAQLARLVGESEKAIKGLLGELENAGVFSRTETGCIYSRRMVNDE